MFGLPTTISAMPWQPMILFPALLLILLKPLRIALLDKPTIVWDFHSLLIGLQMMFSFMMAEDKTPLRMCDSCDTIFVAKRSNQRFCCDACRRKGE